VTEEKNLLSVTEEKNSEEKNTKEDNCKLTITPEFESRKQLTVKCN
jgi:hypothetical protein